MAGGEQSGARRPCGLTPVSRTQQSRLQSHRCSRGDDGSIATSMSEPSPVQAALWQRYRTEFPGAVIWNETLDVLLAHHSTRTFLPDPLPDDTLSTLIAAAQSAPTSSN